RVDKKNGRRLKSAFFGHLWPFFNSNVNFLLSHSYSTNIWYFRDINNHWYGKNKAFKESPKGLNK
ncbi:MAG: hypothetical protein C0490_18330, partial [Marivirga sp.]|nr:hypothetical protein [Marivirga sp.]